MNGFLLRSIIKVKDNRANKTKLRTERETMTIVVVLDSDPGQKEFLMLSLNFK